jgi:ELWxxDGT repeat protein
VPALGITVGDIHYFRLDSHDGERGLWRSDGTLAGTYRIAALDLPNFDGLSTPGVAVLNGALIFAASDPDHGQELWRSDGTTAGTYRVMDIQPGPEGSSVRDTYVVGDKVIFFAHNDEHFGLWRTDGTAAGTSYVGHLPSSPYAEVYHVQPSQVVEKYLFHSVYKHDVDQFFLWVTDGTPEGTFEVFPFDGTLRWLADGGNMLIFKVEYTVYSVELDTLTVTPFPYATERPAYHNGLLYMGSDDLRVLDTSSGTVTTLQASAPYSRAFTAYDGGVAITYTHNGPIPEVWTSDGTPAGTGRAFAMQSTSSSSPMQLTADNERLFYTAFDESVGTELHVSDGTPAGTRLVKDVYPGSFGAFRAVVFERYPIIASLGGTAAFPLRRRRRLLQCPVGNKRVSRRCPSGPQRLVLHELRPRNCRGKWCGVRARP